jgi:hypothetical protein
VSAYQRIYAGLLKASPHGQGNGSE